MKRVIVVVGVLCFFSSLNAQVHIETMEDVRLSPEKKILATETFYIAKDFTEKWGVSVFNYLTNDNKFAELLIGPTFRPVPELTLGVQIGLETRGSHLRGGASLNYLTGKSLINGVFEVGGRDAGESNYWYSITYQNISHKVIFGPIGQRFYGWGMLVGVKVGKHTVSIVPFYMPDRHIVQPTMFWKLGFSKEGT